MNSAPTLVQEFQTPERTAGSGVLTLGNASLNLDTYDLYVAGQRVGLTRLDFDLLLLLWRQRDHVVAREVIIQSLWLCRREESFRRLNTAIHRLRAKLADSFPYGIRMVRRRGYGFCRTTLTFEE